VLGELICKQIARDVAASRCQGQHLGLVSTQISQPRWIKKKPCLSGAMNFMDCASQINKIHNITLPYWATTMIHSHQMHCLLRYKRVQLWSMNIMFYLFDNIISNDLVTGTNAAFS